MSTFLDFAIGLSLVNGISSQISRIMSDFRNLDGVTDDTMNKLSQFKDISITGGLLAGAGVAGLKLTMDALNSCVDEAEKLQSVSTTLEIKAFGKDLLDESKIPQIKAQMEELEDTAMNVSLDTVFNQQQIEESMISMIKGGMSKELVAGSGAEANAYFAQINEVNAVSTADATVKFAAGFQLDENQIKDSLDLVTKYSDASIANALAIQQNIGNVAGSAMAVWKDRDNMQVAEETIQLVAATKYMSGDEASAATMTRNFLDEAGKTFETMTDTQAIAMAKAGWITDAQYQKKKTGELKIIGGESIFIDYNTGMLKSAEELEKVLENTASNMEAVDFNNLLDTVFGDRGKKTAMALSQKGGATDLSTLKTNAGNQLGIDEQVARQMNTAAAQVGIFQESINTLKATLGKPFLEGKTAMFKIFNNVLGKAISYFKEHPQVTKYMAAIAAGTSAFLLIVGTIMTVIGMLGALKTGFASVGLKLIKTFIPAIPVLLSVVAVVAILAGLAFVVYKNWDIVKPLFQSIMEHLQKLFSIVKTVFKSVADSIMPALKEVLKALEQGALWFISFIIPIINNGIDMITEIIAYLAPYIHDFAKMLGNFIVAVIPVIKKVVSIIGKVISILTPIMQKIVFAIIKIIISLIPMIQKSISIISKIINKLIPIIKKVISVIGKIINELMPIIREIISAIGKIINEITPVFKKVISIIGKIINEIIPIIKKFIDTNIKIINKLTPIIKKVISVISKIINELMPIINKFINANIKIIRRITPIIQKIIYVIGEAISITISGIKKFLEANIKIMRNLLPIITPIIKKVISVIGEVGRTAISDIKKFVEANIKIIDGLLPIITPIMQKIFSLISKSMNLIMDIIQKTVSIINKIISAIMSSIENIFIIIIGYFKDFIDWISKAWDKLKGFLSFKKEAKEELENPININVNKKGRKEKISATSNAGETNENIGVSLNFNINSLKENQKMIEQYSQYVTVTPEMDMTQIGKQMSALTGDMNTLGIDGTTELANGLSGTDGIQLLGTSVNTINSTITDNLIKYDQTKTYGSNLIQSFVNGINSKTEALKTAVETIANVMGDYLAVHSPTRKGALHTNHLWGGNLIQSFIKGMENKRSSLESNITSISKTIGNIDSDFNDVSKNLSFEVSLSKKKIPKNITSNLSISKNNIPKVEPIKFQIPKITSFEGSIIKTVNDTILKLKSLSIKLNLNKADIPKNIEIGLPPFHTDILSIPDNIKNINKDNYKNKLEMPSISSKNITNTNHENSASVYITINGADKKENEIAHLVIEELVKRGYIKNKKSNIDLSLVNSRFGFSGGW